MKKKFKVKTAFKAVVCGVFALNCGVNAFAGQVLNTSSTTSCAAQGGVPGSVNFITDFDDGTFGVENGNPNQSPNSDPYSGQITGGVFDHFYDFDHGDYGYVANPVEPRNKYQHAEITDPVYGVTGRFFASDPNTNTPTLNFAITNVNPNNNYQLSFWAANSEPNGVPNIIDTVVDGIVSYSTGPLLAFPAALEWKLHSFVFNAGNRTTILLSMASRLTGAQGRDFYMDNVEMRECTLAGGGISGTIYTDYNANNSYDVGGDAPLAAIDVQLWNTQGDTDPGNDIYVSVTSSGSAGLYNFANLPASGDYELRVDTGDADLPTGQVSGTPTTLPVTVTTGMTASGNDFGFDTTEAALIANKTIASVNNSYNLPGDDVIYTIEFSNVGSGDAATDSIFLVDTMPPDISFYNADLDGAGAAASDPVSFTQSAGAGLNFVYSRDVGFAAAGPPPSNFGACNYTPVGITDPNVAYICFNPKGAMTSGSPNPTASVSFRSRIN